ncbi:MAG: hypothetical protein R2712_10380 [Vicinamibacterales bacterium]
MAVGYRPLLQTQRDLYALPRDLSRFRAYLATLRDEATGEMALPLSAMNPMGKDHVPALLDAYLALGADDIGARAAAEAGAVSASEPGAVEATLVVSDDLHGGWTNRWASEFGHRFECQAMITRGWAVGILWTSEPASADAARRAVLTAIHRFAYVRAHGTPTTLRDMLAQEGHVMALGEDATPRLDAEDLAYTREVIGPHLDATDRATQMACCFGDACARALGYDPMGLSDRAGFALALADYAAVRSR